LLAVWSCNPMTEAATFSETSSNIYHSSLWHFRENGNCHSQHTVKFKSAELNSFGHTKCTGNLLSFSSKPYNEEWPYCGILAYDEELYFGYRCVFVPTAVTALSKLWVCSLSLTGIAASNPVESVDVFML